MVSFTSLAMSSALGVMVIVVISFVFNPLLLIEQYNTQQNFAKIKDQTCIGDSTTDNSKVIILTFDDSRKSQYLYAAPILQKCGFKATFFTVCNFLGQDDSRMTWDDIITLQKQGNDIESHTMNHYDLAHLSMSSLEYEISQSQKCLLDHHINSTVFASPYGNGWNNKTIIDTVSKYYSLGREGYESLTFLHCVGWNAHTNQTDCRTYSNDGQLNFANRYSIRAWDHNYYDISLSHNDTEIFNVFVKEANKEINFNQETIRAIPIIVYHNVDFSKYQYDTDVDLFSKEMNYLHENGFKVITMADLGYDEKSNSLYIK